MKRVIFIVLFAFGLLQAQTQSFSSLLQEGDWNFQDNFTHAAECYYKAAQVSNVNQNDFWQLTKRYALVAAKYALMGQQEKALEVIKVVNASIGLEDFQATLFPYLSVKSVIDTLRSEKRGHIPVAQENFQPWDEVFLCSNTSFLLRRGCLSVGRYEAYIDPVRAKEYSVYLMPGLRVTLIYTKWTLGEVDTDWYAHLLRQVLIG